MNYGLQENLVDFHKKTYAKEASLTQDFKDLLDCSTGINPFGCSPKVKEALKSLPIEAIQYYPEDNLPLKKAIIEYWENHIALDYENILFGSGSIDIIYKINRLFLNPQSRVLGYSPQFSDYIGDVQSYGATYDYHLMNKEDNYTFMPQLFLEKMNKNHKLLYIDNPNNPTGQVIPLTSIETITKKAFDLGISVIVDEAYGDFMDKENSAITLLKEYDNLFILRTFSKGLGLAGLRGGYLITSEKFASYYHKVSNPYVINGIANYLGTLSLRDEEFIQESRKGIRKLNAKLMGHLNKFRVLETDLNTPIITIQHPHSDSDFCEILKGNHILSISGESFIGLDKRFVRLRLPIEINPLINVFSKIEKNL